MPALTSSTLRRASRRFRISPRWIKAIPVPTKTGVLTTYKSQDAFKSTYTQTGTLAATSKVSSVGTTSLGVTADVSDLLQIIGINLGLGTTSTVISTYTQVDTQKMQAQEISQGVMEATNSIHDNVNPPIELVVNALLDSYFGGTALQIPSMQIAPPPARTDSKPGEHGRAPCSRELAGLPHPKAGCRY